MDLFEFGLVFLFVYFLLGWGVTFITKKLAWVDFFWASSFAFVAGGCLLRDFLVEGGESIQLSSAKIVLPILVLIWSIRLSVFLLLRLRDGKEDPRYEKLKTGWGESWFFKAYWVYLMQMVLVLFLSLPLLVTIRWTVSEFGLVQVMAVFLFLLGLVGETLADWQMKRFKRQNQSKNEVCNAGLWRYSRHPNYFFEIVIWFSYAIYCVNLPQGYWAWAGAFLMTFFIVRVTGVAPSERQALSSKGDRYRSYQKKTSMLIPWPPKEGFNEVNN